MRTEASLEGDLENRVTRATSLLNLLQQLETSLDRSLEALVALDVSGIERENNRQLELLGQLPIVITGFGEEARSAIGRLARDSSLNSAIIQRAQRIRQAARVQAGILQRAGRKLRLLANTLAGPSTSYLRATADCIALAPVVALRGDSNSSCRA